MPIQVRQHEPAVLRFTVVLVDSPYYLSDSPCNLRFSVQPEGFLRATRGFFVNPADSPCKPAGSPCKTSGFSVQTGGFSVQNQRILRANRRVLRANQRI